MSETAERLAAREPSAKYLAVAEPALVRGFELLATAKGGVSRLRELIAMLAVRGTIDKPRSATTDTAPSTWPTGTLGNVVTDSEAGWSPSCESGPRSGDAWGVLKVSAVSWGEFRNDENKRLPSHLAPRPALAVREADFLLSRANTVELVARSVVAFKVQPRLMLSDKLIRLRLAPEADPRFFNIVNNAPDARAYYARNASGTSSSMKNVSRAVVLALPVPIPPLAEQHRIVARVEELMKLCDTLEQNGRLADEQHARLTSTLFDALAASESAHALTENWQRVAEHFDLLLDRAESVDALEQTMLQLAVRGLLVAQDAQEGSAAGLMGEIESHKKRLVTQGMLKSDKPLAEVEAVPFEIPPNWEWVRLGSIGEAFDYGTSQKSVDDPSAVPVLRMGNIQSGEVVMTGLKYLIDQQNDLPRLLLRPGDLLFNRTNSYELVGKTGLYEGFRRDVTFASYLIRIQLPVDLCSAQYVNIYMNTIDCRRHEIEPDLTQQTGQANYNGTKLRNIRVPLPPLGEQRRIVARVAELRDFCNDLRKRLTEAREAKSRLADALVAVLA